MSRVLKFDLLIPIFILIFFSLTTLVSLDFALFRNQLIFTFLGLIVFFTLSLIDYRVLKKLASPILIFSLIALYLVLLIGIEARGATRWLAIGGLRLQLSEILKPFLLVSFASFLIRQKLFFMAFLATLVVIGLVVLPIFFQPDLGNTLVYIFTAVIIFIFYGVPIIWFMAPTLVLAIASPILWQILRDYQRERIISFINPTLDPQGTSYNLIQSVIAIGGGQFFGRGLGHGTQSLLKFLPERHTDFIFSTIAENFGFVGAVIVIAAFVFLLFRIYDALNKVDDQFGKLICGGVFSFLLVHFIINIGGNLGVLPITGITLPLVSYGGSSLLSTFILLGLVSSIANLTARSPQVLEIR
ncbi:rod shape-determining protein RodA [Candidatus Microgenomates bacterium]|nr:rod shape-determining protein RodA [Candidatus Microgenomates bacterium]